MKEEWIVKSEDIPADYGTYPGSRHVEELVKSGLVILDKWAGPTSHDVVSTVKKILGINKAGHSGTLDPQVTGVLPVTLENACKVMPALQHLDKEYVGIIYLHKEIGLSKLEEAAKDFVGAIKQTPPLRSAVARKERTRKVYSFNILEKTGKNAVFRISCEAGTYVRMICHELGRKTGGAHMKELRRTRVGRFTEENSVRMQDLADSYSFWKENGDEKIRDCILPVEAAVEHLGKIIVKDSSVHSVSNGSPLYSQGISRLQKIIKKNDLVALLTLKGELIALGNANASGDEIASKRILAAKIDRVIMDRDAYPKLLQ